MNKDKFLLNKKLLLPENMILMYARGAFPMADETGEINWYMPDVRTIIPLNSFNIPRSLKKFLLTTDFEFCYDKNPFEVIRECAKRESTWISNELIEAYKGLHRLGYLHSVEVFQNKILVGGLYGIDLGHIFCGESMFSKVSNASKFAFIYLVQKLEKEHYTLIDCQVYNAHLNSLGAEEISRSEFLTYLKK